ncbi:MAG TPA: DinB family protein [Terriglobales bacterium]|nr:DinB family protein [Terriglobales bacterium]
MDFIEHLRRLFAYDDWANRETLRLLRAAEPPPARSQKLLAHILAAELLWRGRLVEDDEPVVVWPELSLEGCEARLGQLSGLWQSYLGALDGRQLSHRVAYVNSKGEPWESAVEDVLLHVVMHSAYHRGQIASDMRNAGHTPAYTDFIHCVRQGLVK